MKTKDELIALKSEIETLGEKLAELSEEELNQIIGGMKVIVGEDSSWFQTLLNFLFKNKS